MICLYHLDDDGKCAAAVVNDQGKKDSYEDKFIAMDYGRSVPFDQIHLEELVYIVDFSLLPEDMLKLMKITKNIIWIDHHISAIQKYDDFPHEIEGLRSTAYSGCMLTWMYLTNHTDWIERDPKELIESDTVPYIITLCDDWDLWRFNMSETRAFHMGFGTVPHEPLDTVWYDNDTRFFADTIAAGRRIITYRSNMMKELIQSYGYECAFEGYKCFVLNQGLISSDDFWCLDISQYDILVGWIYDGNNKVYTHSLRSLDDGPDVRELAIRYGGGGHVHASGFSSTNFIFS